MTRYYIPQHVRFVSDGDAVVFMDIRSDEYSLLTGEQARTFSAMELTASLQTPGTQRHFVDTDLIGPDAVAHTVISDLIRNNLLTDNPCHASHRHYPISRPASDLFSTEDPDSISIGALAIWQFSISCALSAYRLRVLPFESVIRSIIFRKQKTPKNIHSSSSDVYRLVAIFRRLRPYFPRDFLCLFDSLALIEFLARYHIHVNMIFAVKLDPWSAHCWAQYGQVALNESIESTREYLPILSV